jgi:hypothetical protein
MRVDSRTTDDDHYVEARNKYYRDWQEKGFLDLKKTWGQHVNSDKEAMVFARHA